ncbi:hypothetical protein ACFFRR_004764 [Megaselia abdita]
MECKICLKRFSSVNSPAVSLPCDNSHTFHSDCLTHWFVNNRECPVCGKASSSDLMTPLIVTTKPPVAPNSTCILVNAPEPTDRKNEFTEDDCHCCALTSCCCCFAICLSGFGDHNHDTIIINNRRERCCSIL